jgi:osmotically-inducible protein OsmY
MKTSSNRNLFAAAILGLALVAGCASTAKQESTGEYLDDTTLTTKVKAKFVDDKAVSAMNINVETFKGTVQLSGFANSQAEADRAVQIARATEGVKSVKNDIRLK